MTARSTGQPSQPNSSRSLVPPWEVATFVSRTIPAPTRGRPFPPPLSAPGPPLFYLPPYSPDLNPIEQLVAMITVLWHTATPCSLDVWAAVGDVLLTRFQPAECANYFQNSGYGPPNRNPL